MFHWICPECGREIPPSVRACEACDPSAVAPAVEPVQSASLVEASPAPPPLPEPLPLVESLAIVEKLAAAEAGEPVPEPETAPAPVAPEPVAEQFPVVEVTAEPVAEKVPVEPLVEQFQLVEATPVATESAPVAEADPVAAEPVAEKVPVEPVVEQFKVVEASPLTREPEPASQAEATPAVEAVTEEVPQPELVAAPDVSADLKAASQEPANESPIKLHEVPDPLFALAVEIRAVQAARAAALAAPQEPSGILELAEAVAEREPVALSVAPHAPQETPVLEHHVPATGEASTAVALLAPPAAEKTLVMEVAALAALPQPVSAPEPTTQPQRVTEPQIEPEGPMLPFAPMQDYTPATSRSILPVPPRQQILSADSGPRITLPGPTLPPELTRLQAANVVTVIGEQTAQRTKEALPPKSGGAPGWLVSALVMIVLLAAGLAVVYFLLLPRTVADAKPAPTQAVAATAPAPTGGNSPLAKFIEVTGFRIVTSSSDANKKSEVQYLVVNHSDADISDANVFITLRGAKPGLAPLCRFSFKIPALGPFEAKEMSSPIEKSPRSISLPDWQDVRAEVQISQ